METTQTKEETSIFEVVAIKMRLGVTEDFKREILLVNDSGKVETIKRPNIGQSYWLKSETTKKFDNRNYQINEDTDWSQFKDYMRRNMVYVAVSGFDIKDAGES